MPILTAVFYTFILVLLLAMLNERSRKKQLAFIKDKVRAPVIKQIFEKVAYEKWSGLKVYNWLRHDLNFRTRGSKRLTLGGIYRILDNPFYYGTFEYPRNSGNWYQGKHKPLITQELFEKARAQYKKQNTIRENKEFAFTKLIVCGRCGSGITAEEKYKQLKDGTRARYVYYGCSRARDRNCRVPYIREKDLIEQLIRLIDKLSMNELGIQQKFEEEVKRLNKFRSAVFGEKIKNDTESIELDIRTYAK